VVTSCPGPAPACPPGCLAHREHVYILCYGTPTVIREGDCGARPVTHYVGYTRQQPPVKRVWQHGRGSARALTQVRPGTMRDEARAKCLERCPRCGARLWYLAGKQPSAEILAAGGLFISPRENHVRLRP
jgi:hypothetical protein